MRSTLRLLSGELKRLVSYKILQVSLVTSIIWIIIFLLVSRDDALQMASLFIFVDITAMLIMLIGASHHLERQEGTIKSMMVMPVSMAQILSTKVAASMILGLESVIITSAALFFVHDITFNYALMLVFIVVAGASHAAIGFSLALSSKDFTSMLGGMMIYMFIFTIPSLLYTLGIIDTNLEWLFMLSPSHSAGTLIGSVILGEYDMGMILFACIYLLVLALLLFRLVVYPRFKNRAVRG